MAKLIGQTGHIPCTYILILMLQHCISQPDLDRNSVHIQVTACDGWQYASTSNALQIQLKGQYDATPFAMVNPFTALPTNGLSQIFHTDLNYYHIYGSLFSVLISMDDMYGYCLKGISINLNNTSNELSESIPIANTTSVNYGIHDFYYDHFGDGVILAKKCQYTYRSLSMHRSLVRCFDDYFEIYSRFTLQLRIRGVYKTVAHTCIHPESGISALDMRGNVYAVIMGKLSAQNVYDATEFEYLDHVQVGYVDLDQLGHVVAANVMLTHQYAFYSRDIEGEIIGIKLEAVGFSNNQIYFGEKDMLRFGVKIDGQNTDIHSISVLGSGQYLVAFLTNRHRKLVSQCSEIIIYAGFANSMFLNIFVIFAGFNDEYKLPFVVEEYTSEYQQDAYESDEMYPVTATTTTEPPLPYEQYEQYPYETTGSEETVTESTISDEYEQTEQYEHDKKYDQNEKRDTNKNYKKKYHGKKKYWYGQYANEKERRRIQEESGANIDVNIKKHVINWFDANKHCMDKHGTWLTSIHSVDENFLIHGFIGNDDAAWIGFIDFDINSMYNNHDYNGCYMKEHNTNPYAYNCDWKWIDGSFVDYVNWKSGGTSNLRAADCVYMDGTSRNGGWMDTNCENRDKLVSKYVCLSGKWYPDHKRKWEINKKRFIDEYALITIGNDHLSDALCIDSVSVGLESQVFITVNWIGGGYIDSALNSIFKAPVCKTEVIELRPQYHTQIFKMNVPNSVMPDQLCQNEGRMGQSEIECRVEQNYQLGLRTVFRLSSGTEQTENVLWSSISSVTLTTKQTESITTANVLGMDQLFRIKYTRPGPNGSIEFTNIRSLNLIPILSWFDVERNVDALEDDIDINFDKQQWERVSFGSLSCEGIATVPASHALRYEMQFNSLIMQVNLIVDLKLTLCPEFVNSQAYNQDTLVIYAHNVDAQILHGEPTSCYIKWYAAEYLENTVSCADEQKMYILTQEDGYLPLCRKGDSLLYDGCQCNHNICWCVDLNGNVLDGQAMQIPDAMTWQEICVNQLKCNDSEVIL